MRQYGDKELEGVNAADTSDSENEDITQPQISQSVSSIPSAKSSYNESPADHLPEPVNEFFQSVNMNCFPEAEGMDTKAQPWRIIWAGPQPPAKDGKLLVACPKNCQYGSGSGLGGY